MEIIEFNKNIKIYKSNLIPTAHKKDLLKKINKVITDDKNGNYTGGFTYSREHIEINEIIDYGINMCCNIHKKYVNIEPDIKINEDLWINIVKSNNPVQQNYHFAKTDKNFYHNHDIINYTRGIFEALYTFIYYYQMPNNLNGDDGKLFFLDEESDEIFEFLPKENDIIVFKSNISHGPYSAANSTKHRIVIAGNIGFDKKHNIKKHKNLF
jgi:hypothetical protein